MPIDFPNSPTNGDTYSEGTKTWQYNGTAWDLVLGSVSIPSGSVDTAQLASGAVTTAKIAANAVTQANLASTLSGVTICTSSTKPGSPFVGQMIYMTDTDETAVWEGEYWEGLNRGRDRNVVINGAMQVHQRGTSTAGITSDNHTADRFITEIITMGTWTQTVENDAPTGSGFRKSLKMLCTTADASPAAGDLLMFSQRIEGLNLQQFLKGTAEAKQFTLSFYVKASLTGTYIASLLDVSNSRSVSIAYTVVASNTWEKKTITFPADTTGQFNNDNNQNLQIRWFLGVGSNRSSGTLNTTWQNHVTANLAVGQTNLAAATNNYWQITGVQLEASAVATPFEFENISTTLAKCQRYFIGKRGTNDVSFFNVNEPNMAGAAAFPVTMRATPTITIFDNNTINQVSLIGGGVGTISGITSVTAHGFASAAGTNLSSGIAGVQFNYQASAEI